MASHCFFRGFPHDRRLKSSLQVTGIGTGFAVGPHQCFNCVQLVVVSILLLPVGVRFFHVYVFLKPVHGRFRLIHSGRWQVLSDFLPYRTALR